MWKKLCISIAPLVTVPLFSQVTSPVQGSDQMATPPPVSGEAYPTAVGAEMRSNYLSGGLTFISSYIDNLYPGNGSSRTLAETTYSVWPTLDLDQSRPLSHLSIKYSPGFTFYHPTSALNEMDQNARVAYQVRLSPHSSLNLSDGIEKSSTSFGSAAGTADGSVSGSITTVVPGTIAPFAKRVSNIADGDFTLQTARNTMIGFSGTTTLLHYPDPSQAQGLYDSNSRGGAAFYSSRISADQYLGASYGYTQTHASSSDARSDTDSHIFAAFYTLYPKETLSISVSAGPQYFRVSQTSVPTTASWGPSMAASVGWQGIHTSFAVGYSQSVTGGGGLLGAYRSKSGGATLRWQMLRTWTTEASGQYAINRSVSSLPSFGYENGHTVSGSAAIEHPLSRTIRVHLEYDRIRQSYGTIPAFSNSPDANRLTASISWQFLRPLGR